MVVKQTEEQEVVKVQIKIPEPHSQGQLEFVRDMTLRKICKAGRRWGKTVGVSIIADEAFLGVCSGCGGEGCSWCDNTGRVRPKRVLYAAPTDEQVGKFWFEVTDVLLPGVEAGQFKKDETKHIIEVPGTEVRIRAKTAWNASTMRGDWGDLVIMEEYQLWNEDAWHDVVQPMLVDTNGMAIFIFTPPSLKSEGVSKAKDPRHATKMYKRYQNDKTGRWKTFHFTTFDNPTLSKVALKELVESGDMSLDSYRREILAEDDEIETSWLVYNRFNEAMNKVKRFEVPKEWSVLTGHDFGKANPAALFLARVQLPLPAGAPEGMRYGDYVIFKEYFPGGGYSISKHIDDFKEITKDRKVELSVGGNLTTEDQIREGYTRAGWLIREPVRKRVDAQIDRVIALFEQCKIYIFEDLFGVLTEIANCMWELDEENKPKNKIQNESKYHFLSCLRTLATYLPIERQLFSNEKRKVRIW